MVVGETRVIGGRVGREVVIFVVLLVGLMEWWVVGVVWWRVWSWRRGVLLRFAVKSLVDVLLVVTVRRRIMVACMCFLLIL